MNNNRKTMLWELKEKMAWNLMYLNKNSGTLNKTN